MFLINIQIYVYVCIYVQYLLTIHLRGMRLLSKSFEYALKSFCMKSIMQAGL